MNKNEIIGKSICLLLMSKDDKGKDDWAAIKGEIIFENGHALFRNSKTPKPFLLPDNSLHRIKEPTEDVRGIVLNCDFFLPLSIGPVPEGENPDGFIDTGLQWPAEKKKDV